MEKTISPIFIVGMPRSGTTLVEQIISSHSQVTGAGELSFVEQFQATGDEESIDGVVFSSKKDKIFLAGADLFEMKDLLDLDDRFRWSN